MPVEAQAAMLQLPLAPQTAFFGPDVFGFFLPMPLVWGVLALLPFLLMRRLIAAAGLYRLVWHRPLFDLALYIVILGLLMLCVPRLVGGWT